jgi:hypothetical protein
MYFSKFTVVLISTFFSSLAFSQSVIKVTENVEANFYVRSDSVRKNGNSVEFWQITDFKQARQNKKGESYYSMDQRLVIDCGNSTQNLTFMKVYSSPMASGNLIASGSMSQKNPIPYGTSLEVIKNFVCR